MAPKYRPKNNTSLAAIAAGEGTHSRPDGLDVVITLYLVHVFVFVEESADHNSECDGNVNIR